MDLSADLLQYLSIPYYSNLQCNTLGMDHPSRCFDIDHYRNFGPVHYQFNDLGFRNKPTQEFVGNEILVVGDSFTLGLGVNAQDRWSDQLEKIIDYPVLNFSLNGASNDWISRKTNELLQIFNPRCVIVHWSFSHRREKNRPDWHDDERTECDAHYSQDENFSNWLVNYNKINCQNIIHSAIPNWHDNFPYENYALLPPVQKQDLARDGFHYGPVTNRILAEQITNLLVSL